MKKGIFFNLLGLIMIFTFTGCMDDQDIENSLGGEWVEVYPQSDRTTLIFSVDNKMTLIETGSEVSEIYTYRIENDSIYFSQSGSEEEAALAFDKLEPGRFKIGYLYPSIPESDPDKYMIFEKL